MATLIGNTGSAVIATAETLTSTNTGATVEVNTGTKIIRVPTGVTVSGGNSVGTSGLTVNGNGKAIVIQEGGNIIGGPGNTSNNYGPYGAAGGQGAEALASNTDIKYIKTSGNIVGGGGGGGGPGRGFQTPTIKTYPTWNAWNGVDLDPVQANYINSNYYPYYGMRNSQATSIYYDVRDAIADLADSFKKNTFNYNPTINGADGNSGTVFGPGTVGGDGNSGSNVSVNGAAPQRSSIANWPATNISNEYEIHYLDQEYTHRHSWYDSQYSRQQYVEYTYYMGIYVTEYYITGVINWNWTAYNSSNYSGSYWNKSNSMWYSAVNNANAPIDMDFDVAYPGFSFQNPSLQWNGYAWPTNGGSGGQPGNAYNTTNTTILFA